MSAALIGSTILLAAALIVAVAFVVPAESATRRAAADCVALTTGLVVAEER